METYQTSFPPGDESSQMWTLNKRLEAYLSRVQALEEENELLRAEIHHLRREPQAPSVRKYHQEVMKLRDALDDGHQKMVEVEAAREDICQEIERVKELCLREERAREEARREMSEGKRLLEDERRAQGWLKGRLAQLEEEMEDILRVHEEEKAAAEEEISSFSQRLDSFKVAPAPFQPVDLEDYSARLSQIWQGAVEDYQKEVSALEGGLQEAKENLKKVLEENRQSRLQLQDLDRELLSLKSRKEMLEDVLGKQWLGTQEEEGRLQLEIETLEKEKQDLRAQIAQILEERQQLMHLKMSLSLEVATYRSLLEAENTRIYSPTADYKLSSPFSDSALEKTPLRKRQAESTKTPKTRDYRLLSTKRQSAEKSEQLSHTPSRHLNVKSTFFPSRPSPVTKEFQKVSSVLQSQSLKYTKASTEKAATTLSSGERRIERRPPTEDIFQKSKVETISHTYSQGSPKAIPDKTVRSQAKEQPLDKTVYSKHEAEFTETEAFQNGFLLPGEREIQQKTDYLESSSKTAKDQYPIVHHVALEDQQGSLKVDVNVQDLQSKAQEDVHQTDLPSQVFGNVEADLVVQNEEVVTQVVTCQTVLLEKQEVVQSLEYQNIETIFKEDVTDLRIAQAISEPYTADAKAELLAITPTHEQELSMTLLPAEREEPKALSSDVVSESEPLAEQERDSNGQVSFDLERAIGLSSDVKEDTKQRADGKDSLLVDRGFERTDTEQDDSSLEKVETESKPLKQQVMVDQQILSAPKQSDNQVFNDEKVIEDEEEPVGQSGIKDDIIFDGAESLETCSDDALTSSRVNELSKETDLINAEPHSDEVIVSQEIHSLRCEIDNTLLREREEETTTENEDFDLKLAQSEESEAPSNTVEQEENQLSITRELEYFEREMKKNDVEESSQEHDTEQPTKTYSKEEFVALLEDSIQVSEDSIQVSGDSIQVSEDSIQVSEDSIQVSEDSIQVSEDSIQVSEDSIQVSEDSIQVSEDSIQVSEDSTQVSEDSIQVSEDSVQVSEDSIQVSEDSVQVSEDSIQVSEDSIQVSEDSIRVSEDSVQVSEDSIQVSEDSIQVSEDSIRVSEDSVQVSEDSVQVSEDSIQVSEDSIQVSEDSIRVSEDSVQVSEDSIQVSEDSQEQNQEEQKSLELRCSVQESEIYVEPKTQIICITEQMTEQFIIDTKEFGDHLEAEDTYLPETGLKEIQQELEGLQFSDKEKEIHDILSTEEGTQIEAEEVQRTKLESEEATSQLSDVTQDTVQVFENVEDRQDDKLEEQKLAEPRDVEADQSNTEDNVQLVDDIDDGGQSVDKSQELLSKQVSSIAPETEPVDSLQSFPEEQKDTRLAQTEQQDNETEQQDNRLSLDEDSSPSGTQEAILSPNDVMEEPQSEEQSSPSFEGAENYVEEQALNQFSESKQELGQTFAENVDFIPEELKGFEPQVAEEGDVPTEIDFTASLRKEVVEQPAEEESDPHIKHDITDAPTMTYTVQEDQPEEHESEETNKREEDVQFDESEQAYQELVDAVACALFREEVELESPISADRVQEPETSYERNRDAESKVTFQEESEEISHWIEKVIIQESRKVLSTSTYFEEHEVDTQLVHQACEATDVEGSAMTNLEPERQVPENETEECIPESESIEGSDVIADSQESKGPGADQEPELDHEPLCDTQPEITVQKETAEEYSSKDTQEETRKDTLGGNEKSKDSMNPEADREAEIDQEDVSDSKISYRRESAEKHTREGTQEEISQVSCETVSETVTSEENEENSRDSRNLESDREPDLDPESENKITYQQENVFDFDKRTDEEIREEASEVVSTMIETVFSEKNEEVEQLEAKVDESAVTSTEDESHATEIEAETCISGSENIEPASHESRDPEPDQEPELVQEILSDTEQEVAPQQEDADEHFSKDPEEQTTQDNVEIVNIECVTTKEDDQDAKDFRDSEANEGQDFVEEPPFDTEPPFTLEEKIEEVCFSEATEEEISQETVEPISKTAGEDTTVENQEDSKDAMDSEAGLRQELVEEPLLDTEPQFTLEEQNEDVCFREVTEEEISQETVELLKTTGEDSNVEKQEDSKDSMDSEAGQWQELVKEPLLDTEPQFTLEEKSEELCFSQAIEEEICQETVEPTLKTAEEDITVENQEDTKDSKYPGAEQGHKLVDETLLDTEPQFTLEEKNEEVCFSQAVEEEISQEADGPISKTAEEDSTVDHQEDTKDSKDPGAEQGHKPVDQTLSGTETHVSKTAEQDTFNENEEVKQAAKKEEDKATPMNQEEEEGHQPEIRKEDEISGFDNAEQTTQFNDYEPVSKETKNPKVDQEPEYDTDSQRDGEETRGQSCDVKDVNQDINADVCLTEDYSTSEEKQIQQLVENDAEPKQDRLTLESAKHEIRTSDRKLEEGVSDDTQNTAYWDDPEATIQESFDCTSCPVLNTEVEPDSAVHIYKQETEPDSYQCTEPESTSQRDNEDEHLKQSGEEKEVSEENYEADSSAEDHNQSEETEEISSDPKEPEGDQKIPFSLSIIQNNLRFTSENDAEVRPGKQECELSTGGTDLVLDEKRSESADLQNYDIDRESLRAEEAILEDKDLKDSKQEDENVKEKEEDIVSQPAHQDSTSAPQLYQIQSKVLETETNEQREERATASETESETILVEHGTEQKLNAENPTVTSDFEGPTEEKNEIEDVSTPSNLEDDNSKSDESLDSQDISMYSQKSEDFEISKDYQLEQTLPDSTPLPNLDEEFEDLAEDKVILTSEEAQTVAGSFRLPDLKEEVLDSSSESRSSQVATETEAEEPKQEVGNFAESSFGTLDEPTFDKKHLEASEIGKAECEITESDESLNSPEDISIPSERSENLEASADYQLEKTSSEATSLSNLTDGSGTLAEEQEISEPPQTDDVKEVQKVNIEQSDLTVDEGERVSETTEVFPTAEHPESELASPLNDVIQDESTYTIPEQSVILSGDDRDSVEKEEKDIKEELITKEEHPTGSVIDNTETGEAIIMGDHNGDLPQDPSDERYEGLKTTNAKPFHELKEGEKSKVLDAENLECNQEDIELTETSTETRVVLESDHSISSEDTSPNVTAIGHETDPEDDKGGTEETSEMKAKEISIQFEKVGSEEVEDEASLATKPSQEAGLPDHIDFHTFDEEKDTAGEISDSSFDSNSGNEREAAEVQHSPPAESDIYGKTVNGLRGNTIVQATLDLEDLLTNGHSTGEQSRIVISERKTIVKVEEDIISTHTQDIIEESVLKFATSEGKSEGLFQSLLGKSELKEGTRLDEPSAVQYVGSAADETNYTKKTIKPYLRDSDFTNQAEMKPSLVDEGLIVDPKQQTVKSHQEREDAWSSDE